MMDLWRCDGHISMFLLYKEFMFFFALREKSKKMKRSGRVQTHFGKGKSERQGDDFVFFVGVALHWKNTSCSTFCLFCWTSKLGVNGWSRLFWGMKIFSYTSNWVELPVPALARSGNLTHPMGYGEFRWPQKITKKDRNRMVPGSAPNELKIPAWVQSF